eukprot:maker-scaffold270_size230592-snap-gene-1.18 protein:Tk10971 transcript:maker-scaffold270_size230592-snap-gene-1.18-mRNA-1 annotation:"hypothetical protein DAPPUDRAFT_232075"
MRLLVFSFALLGLWGSWAAAQEAPKPVVCYFGAWSVYRWSYGKFDVESIDPFICTHIIFTFAGLHPEKHTIMSLDPYNDFYDNWGLGAYDRFTALKRINPNLKTLLAIGGWNEGSTKYSDMVKDPASRAIFVESCVEMLLAHGFDGMDLDWEYPGGRDDSPGYPDIDKDNFSALLREVKAAFSEHNFILTAAVAGSKFTIDRAYDVPVLAETLDYINVMSYDFHGWFPNHTFTGHNSPLYETPEEADPDHPGHFLNQAYAMEYFYQMGARKEQILMGMASFGRGFTLLDSSDNGLYAPAIAGCDAGYYTGTAGFWGFNEYCERMYLNGELDQWTLVRDQNVVGPYITKGSQWFGFDDVASFEIKAQFIKDNGFGGAMIWSIDTDDFQGLCGGPTFPLTRKVQEVLNGGPQTPPPGYTTPTPVDPTTRAPSGSTPPPDEICDGSTGLKPDPANCHHYYSCAVNNGEWELIPGNCGDNLAFDASIQACVWPDQVPGCETGTTSYPPTGEDTTTRDPNEITTSGSDIDETVCEGEEGFHRDPNDCGLYYQCVLVDGHYQMNPDHCGDGLYFDMETLTCNWDYLVDCDVKGRFADEAPCSQEGPLAAGPCQNNFYMCVWSGTDWLAQEANCPGQTVFDPQLLVCNYPQDVAECQGGSTTSPADTTPSVLPPSEICDHVGLNPIEGEKCTNHYFECKLDGSQWVIKDGTCQQGLFFNPIFCEVSNDGWAVTECRCDDGLAFDPWIEVCSWPDLVDDCKSKGWFDWLRFQVDQPSVCNGWKQIAS